MAHTQYIAQNHYPNGNVRMRQDFSNVEALQSDKKTEAEKDKIVLDGVNVIIAMPITNESKAILLKETYPEISEEFIDSLTNEIIN